MPALFGIGPDNPVTWGNFYRKGGFRTALGTSSAYFGLLVAFILLSVHLTRASYATQMYATWSGGLLALQVLFTVVIGAGRVSNMIRGDLSSGMSETLRMMPLAARHAVAGYLSAAAASLGGFFLANFAIGLVVSGLSGLPPTQWVAANLILFAFALFAWTVAAFAAFLVRNAAALMVIVSVVGMFGNAGILLVAPGLIVLAGPLVGGTIFNLRTAQTEFATPLIMSLAGQVLVGAIFFAGAARRYRRPDALALGGWLGLALLTTWVGISLLAILRPEGLQPAFLSRQFQNVDPAVPFCGSIILAMLLALIPLCNFARLHLAWARARADDPDLRRPVPPPFPAAVLVTAVLALLIYALPVRPSAVRVSCVIAALFGFSASAIFVAGWFYRSVENAKVILGIWLVAYCVVPLGTDLVRKYFSEDWDEGPVLATASAFSPVGLVCETAAQPDANLRPAAIFHAVIPVLPIGLYLRVGRRKRAEKAGAA
jgi:hypothetical protein